MSQDTRHCRRCDTDVPLDDWGSQTYCRPCFSAYMRERRGAKPRGAVECSNCGERFTQKRSDSRHCSRQCFYSERHRGNKANPQYRARRSEYGRRYHLENRDARLAAGAAWRDANREAFRETQRAWARANSEAIRAARAAYRMANRKALSDKESRRQAALRSGLVIRPSAEQMEAKIAYWGGLCWMCKAPADTIDHVKPIRAYGPHILANMRPACRSCNSSKNSRWNGPHSLSMFIRQ